MWRIRLLGLCRLLTFTVGSAMFNNPVLGFRIVPHGQEYTDKDRLPNGRPAFRVTAPFGSTDPLHPTPHTGMDIGNFNCGDDILAVADGRFQALKDTSGAIGARVILDTGYIFDVWHCAGVLVPHNSRVYVGQRIARIGSTGFSVGCHGHCEAIAPGGKRLDPWPLLYQNIADERRKLNGPGINLRNTGPWGPVYAYSTAIGILKASDGTVLAPLNWVMRRGEARKDQHGDWWVQLWLNGAYRWVFANLTTKV